MSDPTGTRDEAGQSGASSNGSPRPDGTTNGATNGAANGAANGKARNGTDRSVGGSGRAAARPLSADERRERTRRRVIVGAVLLLALNLLVYGISQTVTNTEERVLPPDVQAVTPVEGSVIRPQDTVGVDLADTPYTVDLFVDGVPLPVDEVDAVPELGQFSYRPGAGKTFTRWEPGPHTIRAEFASQDPSAPSATGSIEWSITVG